MKQFIAIYRPQGCVGETCNTTRLFAFSGSDLAPIADRSLLFSCHIRISDRATPGTYPLSFSRVILSDPDGNALPGSYAVDGYVIVERQRPACAGDCNSDGEVTVDELVVLVNIALGSQPVSVCANGDAGSDGEITVDEIVLAVNLALSACPS